MSSRSFVTTRSCIQREEERQLKPDDGRIGKLRDGTWKDCAANFQAECRSWCSLEFRTRVCRWMLQVRTGWDKQRMTTMLAKFSPGWRRWEMKSKELIRKRYAR